MTTYIKDGNVQRRSRFLHSILFLSVSMLACHMAVAAGYDTDTFFWEGSLDPGKTIEIKGVNGGIRAYASSGSKIEVEAVKKGKRNDPEEVVIEVVPHRGGITICAVYPNSGWGLSNECRPGIKGRVNVQNNDVQVNFTIHIPEGVHFIGRTVNGSIEAEDLYGDVEAYTVNGNVDISGDGLAQAETTNGEIKVNVGSSKLTRPLSFKTVNGSIRVTLPRQTDADVEASILNGDIYTDFPLTVKGKLGLKRIRGSIGFGGPKIKLSTVNGSIKLLHE